MVSGGGSLGPSPTPMVSKSLELVRRTDFKPDEQICGIEEDFDHGEELGAEAVDFRENLENRGIVRVRPGEDRSLLEPNFQKCMMAMHPLTQVIMSDRAKSKKYAP
jgi:hypothetical protein